MSKLPAKFILLTGIILVFSLPSYGQQLMIYKDGVSDNQSMKDQSECAIWATQQTGYNPAYPSSSVQYGSDGTVIRGAFRGAAAGAVIGGIASGSPGKGAAAGAAGGAIIGGARKRRAERQQQEYENQMRANFNRAVTTCLQGRGYTVN